MWCGERMRAGARGCTLGFGKLKKEEEEKGRLPSVLFTITTEIPQKKRDTREKSKSLKSVKQKDKQNE